MRLGIARLRLLTLPGGSAKTDLAVPAGPKTNTLVHQVPLDDFHCARAAPEASSTPDLIVGGVVDVGRYFYEERQRFGTYERCMSARGYARTSS